MLPAYKYRQARLSELLQTCALGMMHEDSLDKNTSDENFCRVGYVNTA